MSIAQRHIKENITYWREEAQFNSDRHPHMRWALREAEESKRFNTIAELRVRYKELQTAYSQFKEYFGDKAIPLRYRMMAIKRLGIIILK